MANTQPGSLKRRLLHDIAEIQQDPYPNVHLHFDDANIHKACLVLTPEGEKPLHLRINFWDDYPLRAPEVTIQSRIVHPNVFDSYICATILKTHEGWTSAYTLKGIVIQLLSFFSSDSLEQDHGGGAVKLAEYRKKVAQRSSYRVAEFHGPTVPVSDTYYCPTCRFGRGGIPSLPKQTKVKPASLVSASTQPTATDDSNARRPPAALFSLPDEIVLLVLTELSTRDVLAFADAVPSIGEMLNSYDFIRIRELQCFCLKRSFMDTKLGIGVSIKGGRRPVFRSEFDMLSEEAFSAHGVRNSIQGIHFDKWLPLPLSRRHWNLVKSAVPTYLQDIHTFPRMPQHEPGYVDVLYNFMNTIVVQFSADEEKRHNRPDARSTLSHVSEKAVEAYFSLFHLLLCLATENSAVVTGANRIVDRFIAGPPNKANFPDLGHVLVAALISNAGLNENLTLLIIKEAILRNVVWMLDTKGAGMAELAYLEPANISSYRLTKTFEASPTSYRLLMFLKLFSSAARPPNKTLVELRDDMFDTHGAPPAGTTAAMANTIRNIRAINNFPAFLTLMGITNMPSQSDFTAFLRRTITDSMKEGYSIMPLSQEKLYHVRKAKERDVQMAQGLAITWDDERWLQYWNDRRGFLMPSFFPNVMGGQGGRGRGGGRGGRR